MHIFEGIFDEFRGIADRNIRQQVKIDGHAGELIEVIDRLRTDHLTSRCDRTQRNKIRGGSSCNCNPCAAARLANCVPAVAPHVQVIQVVGRRPLVVFNFQNHLILILRLLN